jgi:hypothetical protein
VQSLAITRLLLGFIITCISVFFASKYAPKDCQDSDYKRWFDGGQSVRAQPVFADIFCAHAAEASGKVMPDEFLCIQRASVTFR